VSRVRDDPFDPDPGFADLYGRLPDAADLEPWLTLARSAKAPVLYLGAGAGRLAAPLVAAGIDLVLVDAHPGMVRRLRERLPDAEIHASLIETLRLERTFDLIIVPSNILDRPELANAAARHLAPKGRLVFELTNPHWLEADKQSGFNILRRHENRAEIEVTYPDGTVQEGEIELVWPQDIDAFLASADLRLLHMSGHAGTELETSPTFYVVAALRPTRRKRPN